MPSRILKTAALILAFCLITGLCAYITLRLIVLSEDTILVPDLINKDVVYVLEILSDLGLNTKVEGSEYSSEIVKNNVIYQDPEPGAEIKKGRDVRIIISKGTEIVVMPDLKGLLMQTARIFLEENSLLLSAPSITYSQKIKKNIIIEQRPGPGAKIKRGSTAQLLVSGGSPPFLCKIPDLNGLSLDEAIILIVKGHFLAGKINAIFDADKPLNSIISQDPLSGYCAPVGAAINFVINRKYGKSNISNISSAAGCSLFRYRVKCGFLKKHVRVNINCYGVSNDALNGFVEPGHEILLLVPNNDAVLFLYVDDELVQTKIFDPR